MLDETWYFFLVNFMEIFSGQSIYSGIDSKFWDRKTVKFISLRMGKTPKHFDSLSVMKINDNWIRSYKTFYMLNLTWNLSCS